MPATAQSVSASTSHFLHISLWTTEFGLVRYTTAYTPDPSKSIHSDSLSCYTSRSIDEFSVSQDFPDAKTAFWALPRCVLAGPLVYPWWESSGKRRAPCAMMDSIHPILGISNGRKNIGKLSSMIFGEQGCVDIFHDLKKTISSMMFGSPSLGMTRMQLDPIDPIERNHGRSSTPQLIVHVSRIFSRFP